MAGYIPSVYRLQEAAKALPDANLWKDEAFSVTVGSGRSGRQISFRRVKFSVSGGKEWRWIYEGKVRVDRPEREE